MRAFLALTIVLGAATAAHAGNHEITLGSYDRALRSSSANAVTDDTLGGGHLGIARALRLDLYPRLEVWATGGLGWGSAEGTLFQTMTTEVDTIAFTLGGRARYSLHRLLHLSARLDLGTARNELTLHGNGHTVSDAGWGATATTAIGVDLMLVARPRFSLGFRFDLGYVTATAVALSPREEGDSSKIELDAMQASIGHLDLGGRFFAFSVLSQF
jgi:hypothetical protein